MLDAINSAESTEKNLAVWVMQAYKTRDLEVITNNETLSPKEKLYAVYAIIIKCAFENHRGQASIPPAEVIPLIQNTLVSPCPFIKSAVNYMLNHLGDGNLEDRIQNFPEGFMVPFRLGMTVLNKSLRNRDSMGKMVELMTHSSSMVPASKSSTPSLVIKSREQRINLGLVDCPLKHAGVAGKIHQTLSWNSALKLRIKRRLQKMKII